MPSNELRIGNLFNFKNEDHSEIAPIYSFNYNLSLISSGTPESNRAYPFNGVTIEPIPLTEEWLLRFGFEKRVLTTQIGVFNEYSIYHDAFNLASIEWLDEEKSAYLCFEGTQCGIDIKYVHQLQNLYFALTGKELEFK